MTADEFRSIRERCGMTRVAFARALGYKGSDNNNHNLIKRIENGHREVMPLVAIKAIELAQAVPQTDVD